MTNTEFINAINILEPNYSWSSSYKDAFYEIKKDILNLYNTDNFIVVKSEDLQLDKQILQDFRNALFELSNCARQILELQKENFELKQRLLSKEQNNEQ